MKKTNATKNDKKNTKSKSKPKPKTAKSKVKQKKKTNPLATARDAFAKVDLKPRATTSPKKPEEEIMDRSTLIGIARLLKDAGSDVKALKSDTDDQLQKKVNEAIQQLPPDEIVKQLEAVDPDKLVNTLKMDCLGIFVDFTDVSCVRCVDAKACVTKFISNIKGGFAHIKAAAPGGATEKPAPAPPKTVVTPVTRYEASRLLWVRDVPNPNPEGDDYHDTIQRVLDEQPETLGELRAIVESEFTLDGDGDFMKFVTALRDPGEGVVKLDVDLSEKDKAALRGAGYDV